MIRKLREAGFKERLFDTDDTVLNYVQGPPTGPPLLLIPGQTLPWQSYQYVLPLLSPFYTTYAVDVRGHGKSGHTPGRYTYANFGKDMLAFIRHIIGSPTIVSGNSSGGVIAVWLGAFAPEWINGVIGEDPPLFSSMWPRIMECFVYRVMKLCEETVGSPHGRDLGKFFARFEVPGQKGKHIMRMPKILSVLISTFIRMYQDGDNSKVVNLPFLPLNIRLFIKGLSEYDPEFTKAFIDNSVHNDFDHGVALSKMQCPMLLVHANWFYHETLGLVGALDDKDVAHVQELVKDFHYVKIETGHIIHIERPKRFMQEVRSFYSYVIRKGSV